MYCAASCNKPNLVVSVKVLAEFHNFRSCTDHIQNFKTFTLFYQKKSQMTSIFVINFTCVSPMEQV